MMPSSGDPLAGLRPLHYPPPVSWWPPAPGWWLAAGLLLAAAVLLVRRFRRTRVQRAALAELATLCRAGLPSEAGLARLASLLKRYALHCYPGRGVAGLSGEAWLRFLDDHGGRGAFTGGAGRPLGADMFRPGAAADPEAAAELVRRWIRRNRRAT